MHSKTTEYSFVICLSALFAGAHRQLPLFSHNQNTYLLQGVSNAVGSPLRNDWLSNQTDPFPIFSWLVEVSYSISPALYYILQGFLATLLMFSLYVIARRANFVQFDKISIAIYFVLFFFAKKYFGALNGLAEQYILGSIFQPSTFGVLLVASVALFISEKYSLAIFTCILAAYFNPSYILQAAFLVLTYQLVLLKSRARWEALLLGLAALVAISPLLFVVYKNFGIVPSDLAGRAQEILALERMYKHAIVSEWLISKSTALAFMILVAAIVLYRQKSDIVLLLAIPSLLSIVFVSIASLSNSLTMLLLFGQRASVWLVPIASSLLIMRLAQELGRHNILKNLRHSIFLMCLFLLGSVAAIGAGRTIYDHHQSGTNELYTFLSTLDYGEGALLIPVNRFNIRLNAKVPVFVDWKSHPYRADEVIDWYARIQLAKKFYKNNPGTKNTSTFLEIANKQKIEFVLVDAKWPVIDCTPIYEDLNSVVYVAETCFRN